MVFIDQLATVPEITGKSDFSSFLLENFVRKHGMDIPNIFPETFRNHMMTLVVLTKTRPDQAFSHFVI